MPAALGSLAIALSGCLSSGFNYLTHRNPDHTVLYFKLPSHWKTFTNSQVIQAANGHLTRSQLSQIESGEWIVPFTAAPHATAPHQLLPFGTDYPAGIAFAHELTTTKRDSYSLSSMRAELLGSDPLASGSTTSVLSYHEFIEAGGLRGSTLVVDIPQSNGKIVTMGQVAVVDTQTNWVYTIGIGCRASCWAPNQGLINQVLKSWHVKTQ